MSDDEHENECKVSVGCPNSPESFGLFGGMWKSYQFHFHDFLSLNSERGKYVASPEFTYNGHQWKIKVYPGGDDESGAEDGDISVHLDHLSEESITVSFSVKTICSASSDSTNVTFTNGGVESWGWDDFGSRSMLLDESKTFLDSDGCLTIVVSLTEGPKPEFVPKNSALHMLTEMFNDEDSADVCFEVSSCIGQKPGKRKKRPKSSVSFHAHRSILRKFAPILADLLGGDDTATIEDMKPEIFCHLLHYLYGGEVPREELKKHAKEIIDAANKYAIVNLKLAAEVAYVESIDITINNAVEHLLYADSMNCALIKEKVVDFLANNATAASQNISFSDCPGHVVTDILNAFVRKDDYDDDDPITLGISELRWKVYKKDLDVDGSREALIESIKNINAEEEDS